MSTHGRIAIKRKDGSYISCYHNSDSYPEYLGKLLVNHWSNDTKTEEAISLGDSSSWYETIEENKYYGRDYGESDAEPLVSNNLQTLIEESQAAWEEYLYVRERGEWHLFKNGKKLNLKEQIKKESM